MDTKKVIPLDRLFLHPCDGTDDILTFTINIVLLNSLGNHMVKFDKKGYISDNSIEHISLTEFYTIFVKDKGSKRKELTENLIVYNLDLLNLIKIPFVQWIDGSFVTKKDRPGDIDVVTFLEPASSIQLGTNVNAFKYPKSIASYQVDAYIVVKYPDNHRSYQLFKSEFGYWHDRFTKTKPDRREISYPKGFIQIVINDESIREIRSLY